MSNNTKKRVSNNTEQRVYVVVADTVQHPLEMVYTDTAIFGMRKIETRSIFQPSGRAAAQVGHAKGRLHEMLIKHYLRRELDSPGAYKKIKRTETFWEVPSPLVTTIVKSARDSYELFHVYNLLCNADILTYEVQDENPEAYGPGEVWTAIATEPVAPEDVAGILDYLPLWNRDGK